VKFEKCEITLSIKIQAEYDIIVCGGGVAGFCAAIAAARAGVKTALVESSGMLGGVMTRGGNPEIGLFYANGKRIIGGIGWEFVNLLKKQGDAIFPDFENERVHSRLNIHVNPFEAALMMDEMCFKDGVDLYFNHSVVDVISEGTDVKTVKGAVLSSISGLSLLEGTVIIDCTGDGSVSVFAGAKYEIGDDATGDVQPATLGFVIGGYDLNDIDREKAEIAYERAKTNGELTTGDYWPNRNIYDLFFSKGINANHIHLGVKGNNLLSVEQTEARRSVSRLINWARNNIKGAENIEITGFSEELSKREWRRVVCNKKVTVEEYVNAIDYDDAVCYSYYPIDLHQNGENSLYNSDIKMGEVPKIPYGALVVKGFNNLLVAGRCICSDRLANSALRVKSSCMAIGQVAGSAAAISVKYGCGVDNVSIDDIKKLCADLGAINP
jgi:ribulose 1,5-bisphosphate synthetase/thiazole synthase